MAPWLETGEGIVVVGDTKADIEFARSIGGSPVGVDMGMGIRRAVRL